MTGQSAAVVGGLLGLVAATALGVLRFALADSPEAEAQMLGNVAFALVYASPYLLTLVVSRTRDSAARGGLLMALGLLSWAASFSTFSLVTVILLPATVAILLGSVLSLRSASGGLLRAAPFFLAGVVGVAAVGFSFYSLFGLESDETRCWALVRGPDGQQAWQSRPNVGGSPHRLSIGPTGAQTIRSTCTSDIITNSEAAVGLGVLAVAATLLIGVSRVHLPQGKRQPSNDDLP